jgi:uncharacterized RDD family membrane protein YckC
MSDNHRMLYAPPRDPTNVMGRRIVAYLIDVILVVAIALALFAATTENTFTDAPSGACDILQDRGEATTCLQVGSTVYTWSDSGVTTSWGLAFLAQIANLVVLQGITGASIGKLIMGLRVVDENGDIARIGRAIVRWLFLVIVDAACVLIGLLTASLTHPHRRVGDFVAGTYVIGSADVGRPIRRMSPPPFEQTPVTAAWVPPATTAPQQQWGGPQPQQWGAPPPAAQQPQPQPQPQPQQWGAPPPPPQWGTSPPVAEPWNAPPPPPQQAPPPQQETPAAQPAAPPPAPRPEPAAPAPPEQPGESWWDKALRDDADDADDDSSPAP